MSTAIRINFHKLVQMERDLLKDPKQNPITIEALLCRFSVHIVLKMKRKGIAECFKSGGITSVRHTNASSFFGNIIIKHEHHILLALV